MGRVEAARAPASTIPAAAVESCRHYPRRTAPTRSAAAPDAVEYTADSAARVLGPRGLSARERIESQSKPVRRRAHII